LSNLASRERREKGKRRRVEHRFAGKKTNTNNVL